MEARADPKKVQHLAKRLGLRVVKRGSSWVLKTSNPEFRFEEVELLSGTMEEVEAALKKEMGWDCPKCGNHSSVITCERAQAWNAELNSRSPIQRAWDRWKYRPGRR